MGDSPPLCLYRISDASRASSRDHSASSSHIDHQANEREKMTTMKQYTEFPSITRQARSIGYMYKWIGLYSIVLLTGVTVVSMTNIFTSGEFAQYVWIKNAWAFIFAMAIDVNIVRLFIEARIEHSKSAYTIGLGLAAVTGAALLIEGLQQSIGIQWGNQSVQIVIGVLIAFRVLFVVVLMAREGYKLGKLIQQSVVQSVLPATNTPVLPQNASTGGSTEEISTPNTPNTKQNKQRVSLKIVQSPEQKIRAILREDSTISVRKLAEKAGCTPATAAKWKKQIVNEQEAIRLQAKG